VSATLKEAIEDLYWKQSLTLKEIGEKLGMNEGTVYWYMKKYEIPRRRVGYPPKHFKEDREETLAYILGVVLGDGSKRVRDYQHIIELNVKDKQFADAFETAVNQIGLHTWRTWKKVNYKGEPRYYHRVIVNSKRLFIWLSTVDLKHYVLKSEENICSFLRGIYESEGSIGTCGLTIALSNDKLISFIQKCIEELGFTTSLYTHKTNGSFRVYLCGGKTEMRRFLEKIKPSIKFPSSRFFEDKRRGTPKYPLETYVKALKLRGAYGWGCYRIGAALNVPPSTVKHWIYEKRVPKETLNDVC
jgi:intein-encoded DNA endonuclease-like protein